MNLNLDLSVNALVYRDSYSLHRLGLGLHRPVISSGCNIFRFPEGIPQSATWKTVTKRQSHGYFGSLVANWIESWLSDRKQRVVINGKCFGWSEISSGVRQGSVLGPILFVIFVNDTDDMKLNGMPRLPRQRDFVNRDQREVDDIFTIITTLNERGAIKQLPRYVYDNSDYV